jgi:hypothetical protein
MRLFVDSLILSFPIRIEPQIGQRGDAVAQVLQSPVAAGRRRGQGSLARCLARAALSSANRLVGQNGIYSSFLVLINRSLFLILLGCLGAVGQVAAQVAVGRPPRADFLANGSRAGHSGGFSALQIVQVRTSRRQHARQQSTGLLVLLIIVSKLDVHCFFFLFGKFRLQSIDFQPIQIVSSFC